MTNKKKETLASPKASELSVREAGERQLVFQFNHENEKRQNHAGDKLLAFKSLEIEIAEERARFTQFAQKMLMLDPSEVLAANQITSRRHLKLGRLLTACFTREVGPKSMRRAADSRPEIKQSEVPVRAKMLMAAY